MIEEGINRNPIMMPDDFSIYIEQDATRILTTI